MDTTNSSEKPQRRVKHGQRPTEPLADWPAEFGAAGAEQPAATSGDAPADLQQLKALALAATPGPWLATHWNGHAPTTVMRAGTTMAIAETAGFGRNSSECAPDAAYIAAANPAVVLDLIARIERAAAPATASGDERADFEAWHRSKFATKHSTGQPTRDMHNGVYAEKYGPKDQQLMWEAFQAGAAVSAATKPTADAESAWKQYIGQRTQLMDTSSNRAIFAAGYSAAATKPTADSGIDELNEFLAWYRANDYDGIEVARAAWLARSLLATKPAAAPAVPEGFVLVPKVPTRDMIAKTVDAVFDGAIEDASVIEEVYAAMLAATPAASTTGAAQTAEQVRKGEQA